MNSLGRFIKVTENVLIKHWSNSNKWTSEYGFCSSKVNVPLPPKRPLTAYMIFCKENRSSILKENPSLSSPEQIKMLAVKWSNLSLDMKKPYELTAREGILQYSEAHKKFYESLTEKEKEDLARLKAEKKESRRIMKLKKALRESGLPKPAVPAYGLFIQAEAKNRTDIRHASAFIKEVAEKWRNLPEDTKKVFEDEGLQRRQRFANEFKEWRSKMLKQGRIDLLKGYDELKKKGKSVLDEAVPESTRKEPPKRGGKSKTTVSKN